MTKASKKANKSKVYKSRKFLNKDSGVAAIETRFEMSNDYCYSGWEAGVTISDCRKAVDLDFCCYSVKDVDATIHKISVLLSELEAFGNLLLENREQAIESIKKAEADRKKRIKERTTKPFEKLLEELNDGDQ